VSPPLEKSARLGAGAVVLLTTCIFVLDLLTPLGWADWLLYFIPLVLTLNPRAIVILMILPRWSPC
jgi:hypothetical protein